MGILHTFKMHFNEPKIKGFFSSFFNHSPYFCVSAQIVQYFFSYIFVVVVVVAFRFFLLLTHSHTRFVRPKQQNSINLFISFIAFVMVTVIWFNLFSASFSLLDNNYLMKWIDFQFITFSLFCALFHSLTDDDEKNRVWKFQLWSKIDGNNWINSMNQVKYGVEKTIIDELSHESNRQKMITFSLYFFLIFAGAAASIVQIASRSWLCVLRCVTQ